MEQTPRPDEKGPLPRSREAVDWWLKKWERTEPLTWEDVERLRMVNGGTAEELNLSRRRIRGENLIRANLRGAYFLGADLQSASLVGANLQSTNLRFANLQDAWLTLAELQSANLWEANLQDVHLSGARLQGANLREAHIEGANLRNAELQGANLQEAKISPLTNLEGVKWDAKYISVLEQRGEYEAASGVYRRLKEWHRARGMLTIAGEFHYREQEASRKAKGQRLIRQFKAELAEAWRRLKGKDTSASPER
jgi:hypothetical protein